MIIDAKKLKIAMARACLGVADLGEKADVGRATIVRILRDDGESVRGKTVGKLARALNVDVLDLIAKEEWTGMKKTKMRNRGITNEYLNVGQAGLSKKDLFAKGIPMNRYERRMLKRMNKKNKVWILLYEAELFG